FECARGSGTEPAPRTASTGPIVDLVDVLHPHAEPPNKGRLIEGCGFSTLRYLEHSNLEVAPQHKPSFSRAPLGGPKSGEPVARRRRRRRASPQGARRTART